MTDNLSGLRELIGWLKSSMERLDKRASDTDEHIRNLEDKLSEKLSKIEEQQTNLKVQHAEFKGVIAKWSGVTVIILTAIAQLLTFIVKEYITIG